MSGPRKAALLLMAVGEEVAKEILRTLAEADVRVAMNETDFSQGSISSTGNATDVALNGNGFFVVGDGSGAYEYSRAGNFSLTSTGQLVTSDGLDVMGYPAANGVVNTNAPLAPIVVPVGQVQQPQATTSLNLTANLNAQATAGTTFPGQATIYDSLGVPHIVTITFTETSANNWNFSAALPSSDFASGVATPVTGSLAFDPNGNLSTITSAGVTSNVGTAAGDVGSIPLAFTGLSDGAADLSMNWSLLSANGSPSLSQVNAASAVSATNQNGFAPGEYEEFTVGSDGTVTVTYSNYQKVNVGQIALANVTNVQGLEKLGDGDYATTLASGTASISTSGSAGLGTLQDAALEGSNVNISEQFSDLIIAQRAFEASSKAVTTFDTVTQETINMIH